jgi:hypothetical protein
MPGEVQIMKLGRRTVNSIIERGSEIPAEVGWLCCRLDRSMMSFAVVKILVALAIVRGGEHPRWAFLAGKIYNFSNFSAVTSMPAGVTTESAFVDYESVDLLNRLPFSPSPSVDYIADFDESVDLTTAADAAYRDLDGEQFFLHIFVALEPWGFADCCRERRVAAKGEGNFVKNSCIFLYQSSSGAILWLHRLRDFVPRCPSTPNSISVCRGQINIEKKIFLKQRSTHFNLIYSQKFLMQTTIFESEKNAVQDK